MSISNIKNSIYSDMERLLSECEQLFAEHFIVECFMHLEDCFIPLYNQLVLFESFDFCSDIFEFATDELFNLEQCMLNDLEELKRYCFVLDKENSAQTVSYTASIVYETERVALNCDTFKPSTKMKFRKLFILVRLFNLLNK